MAFHQTVGVRMLKHVQIRDKEQYDMQIHKRIKDRTRAIYYNYQSKHFGHGFAHYSSHKYGKENNKQSTKHDKEKEKLDGDGTYLVG